MESPLTVAHQLNNTIPSAFAAQTELHADLIDFALPPLSSKIYYWLLRRSRPGTEQEFDKADFDSFCSDRGREPYSIKWFMICFKKLLDTRLVKLVRKYCVYGFKVVVFHPWQLDDWVLNDKPRNTSYRNKTSTNSNKTSKKQTSNVDSAVPSYRGSRENKENTAIGNGSTESCATSKIQDFIAAKKKKFQHPRVLNR